MSSGHASIWQDIVGVAFEQGWVDVGGVSTRYWRAGDPSAPNIVLLHGTGGHVEAFGRNLGAHAQSHQIWAMDLVGHGWSSLAEHDLEIADYCRHVIAFLDAKGIEKAVIGGVSLGGWVASRLAIDHPGRVSALVLVTPGGSQADPKVMQTIRKTTAAAVDELTWAAVRSRLEYLVYDPATINDDLVATRLAIYRRPGMKASMGHILVLQDPVVRARNILSVEQYGKISCPTLIVWTSHDPTATATEGRRIAASIPGAQFDLLDRCAHWPQFENPKDFNELSLRFLRDALA